MNEKRACWENMDSYHGYAEYVYATCSICHKTSMLNPGAYYCPACGSFMLSRKRSPGEPLPKYEVRPVVCDWGVYRNGQLISELIFNNRRNADTVACVLAADEKNIGLGDYVKEMPYGEEAEERADE